jgi:hypothetical protein
VLAALLRVLLLEEMRKGLLQEAPVLAVWLRCLVVLRRGGDSSEFLVGNRGRNHFY